MYTKDMMAANQVGFDIMYPILQENLDFYQDNVILFNGLMYGGNELLQYENEFTVDGRFPCPHSRTSYPSTV